MSRLRTLLSSLSLIVAATAVAPHDAQAQAQTVTVPMNNAYTVIGHFIDNKAYMVTTADGVTCTSTMLGVDGLQGDLTINGTSTNDAITVLENGSVTFCGGITLATVKRNNHRIIVNGLNGSDQIYGGDTVNGGIGRDFINLVRDNAIADGGFGNDWIWGGAGTSMRGGGDDDVVCLFGSIPASTMDGGLFGTDTWCSLAGLTNPALVLGGFEVPHDCSKCFSWSP